MGPVPISRCALRLRPAHLGYEFKPWRKKHAYAGGSEILGYLHEAVDEHGLRPYLHFGYRVVSASFSSDTGRWTVTLLRTSDDTTLTVTCSFFFSATGYYDYDEGYSPEFEGSDDFRGTIVHPQHWPEDLDCAGKRVVVIGSGATAVTLIPALAGVAEHVTMLQRSPSYVLGWPKENKVANALRRALPTSAADRAVRSLSIRLLHEMYRTSRRAPNLFRRLLRLRMNSVLPDDYPVDVHFNPSYDPWDQRLCVATDSDLFHAIATGEASVVTDRIARFTPTGIALESGREIEADVIVTATGLKLVPFGRIDVDVDGVPVDWHECITYKATMLTGVPNFAFAFGYTNSSWTLKVDLTGHHLCRLLDHMDDQATTSSPRSATTPRSAADRSGTSRRTISGARPTCSPRPGRTAPGRWSRTTISTADDCAANRSTIPPCVSRGWPRRRGHRAQQVAGNPHHECPGRARHCRNVADTENRQRRRRQRLG